MMTNDQGEAISFQVIKNKTDIIYASGWLHGDLVFREYSHMDWTVPHPGNPALTIRKPITVADCSNLELRIEKQNDNGQLELLADTPTMQFGKRNPIHVENLLDGPRGVKFLHT